MSSVDSWFHKNESIDESSSDCDSIDSELEFHLYSQVHYGIQQQQSDETCEIDILKVKRTSPNLPNDNDTISINDNKDTATNTQSKESLLEWFKKTAEDFKADNAAQSDVSESEDSDTTIEEWQILDESGSSDTNVPTIHAQPSAIEMSEQKEGSKESSDGLWKVAHFADLAKLHNTSIKGRYYMEGSRVRCKNCDEAGHIQKNCPHPRKKTACFMCGELGHNSKKCSSWHELREWPERKTCRRCGQYGHRHSKCPDNWRRYHVTTTHGVLQTQHRKTSKRRYCSICTGKGHFNYKCESMERDRFVSVHSAMVYDYDEHNHDGPKDGEENGNRKRKNSDKDHIDHGGVGPSKKLKQENGKCHKVSNNHNFKHQPIKSENKQIALNKNQKKKSKKKKVKKHLENLNDRFLTKNNKVIRKNQNSNSNTRKVFWD